MTLKFKWETEFKETEIGETPKDWEVRKIGIVAKVNEELINKNYNYKIIEYIDINSVESGLILEKKVIPLEIAPTRARRVVRNNDILLSTVRPNLRHYAFVKYSKPNTIASTGFAVIRARNIAPRYLYYYITTDFVTEYLTQIAETHTSAYPSFTPDVVENLKTPYPSPHEQSRIATVLSWFDDLIENKKRQNEILEKVAMAIFKSWFVDFEPFKDEEFVYSEELGKEISKGWEVKPIDAVAEFVKGLSYRSNELVDNLTEGEIFITLKIFKRGGGFRPEYKYYRGNRYSDEQVVYDGDLVIALTDMTSDAKVVGAPALVILPPYKDKGILSLDAAKLNVPQYMKEYAYLYLKDSQEENSTFANGVNVLHLNLNLFKIGKLILIPPQPILQHFHFLVEPLFQKIILNQKQIMVLRKIRDVLLPQLVFGKLEVVEL